MEKEPRDKKPDLKSTFNGTARVYGIVSGFTGGMLFGIFSLAMYSQHDSKAWLAGAMIGFTGGIGSLVQAYRVSKQQSDAAPPPQKNKDDPSPPPAPKP